jgi:hypothetical protein
MSTIKMISERVSLPEQEWKRIRGDWFSGDTQDFIKWMRSYKKIKISRVTVGNAINRNIASYYLWNCLNDYMTTKNK